MGDRESVATSDYVAPAFWLMTQPSGGSAGADVSPSVSFGIDCTEACTSHQTASGFEAGWRCPGAHREQMAEATDAGHEVS